MGHGEIPFSEAREAAVEEFVSNFQGEVKNFFANPLADQEVDFKVPDYGRNFKVKLAEKITKLLARFPGKKFEVKINEGSSEATDRINAKGKPIYNISGEIEINGVVIAEYFRESPGGPEKLLEVNFRRQERRNIKTTQAKLEGNPLRGDAEQIKNIPKDPLTLMLEK